MSYLWKKFQDEMVHEKTSTNKAQYFFWVSSQRYQYFRHILQNPKVPKNIMGSNNHNLWYKLLNGRALTTLPVAASDGKSPFGLLCS